MVQGSVRGCPRGVGTVAVRHVFHMKCAIIAWMEIVRMAMVLVPSHQGCVRMEAVCLVLRQSAHVIRVIIPSGVTTLGSAPPPAPQVVRLHHHPPPPLLPLLPLPPPPLLPLPPPQAAAAPHPAEIAVKI